MTDRSRVKEDAKVDPSPEAPRLRGRTVLLFLTLTVIGSTVGLVLWARNTPPVASERARSLGEPIKGIMR